MKKRLKIIIYFFIWLLMLLIVFVKPVSLEIERKIIFKPSKNIHPLLDELSSKSTYKHFFNDEGQKLYYLHILGKYDQPSILFFHGNRHGATNPQIQKKLLFLAQKGYEIFAFDYGGYGYSQGTPSEKSFYRESHEFVDYLQKEKKIKLKNSIIWGYSMGGAVTVNLALKNDYRGVIVEGSFTSISGMRDYRIQHVDLGSKWKNKIRDFIYLSIPISHNFDSTQKIQKIKSPLFIVHSKQDQTVPWQMSEMLSKKNKSAKTFFSESGKHNESGWQEKAINDFISQL